MHANCWDRSRKAQVQAEHTSPTREAQSNCNRLLKLNATACSHPGCHVAKRAKGLWIQNFQTRLRAQESPIICFSHSKDQSCHWLPVCCSTRIQNRPVLYHSLPAVVCSASCPVKSGVDLTSYRVQQAATSGFQGSKPHQSVIKQHTWPAEQSCRPTLQDVSEPAAGHAHSAHRR